MKNIYFGILILMATYAFAQDYNTQDKKQYINSLLILATKNAEANGTKALSYIDESFEYEKSLNDTLREKLYHTAGTVYFVQESYYLALKYYNKQLELHSEKDDADKSMIYNNIGNVYWRLGNLKKAREYWEKSLNGLKKNSDKTRKPESFIVYNNLAVLERTEGNNIKALEMLEEYKNNCISLNDRAGLVKAYQNISISNIDLKDYDLALKNFHLAKSIAKKNDLKNDLASIYFNLGSFYTETRPNVDSAAYYHLQSYDLSDQYQFPFIKKMSAESLIDLYEKKGDFKSANKYLHTAKKLGEEMISEENTKKISQLEQEHKQKTREQEILSQQKRKDIIYIISSLVLVLISIITILIISLQKNKLKRRAVENELLEKQLQEKNKTLVETAIQMMQSQKIIDTTHKELAGLKDVANLNTKKELSRIIIEMKSGSKGFNKNEFEKLFKETHEDFYKILLQKYPTLTRNEIRMCAFSKLNLSVKDICAITQQSPNSILAARYRLRKKLELNGDKSLTSFLINLSSEYL